MSLFYRDIVPHVPIHRMINGKIFTHISGEFYETETGDIIMCEGYEDPQCSFQWYVIGVEDHLRYLNIPIGCSDGNDDDNNDYLRRG